MLAIFRTECMSCCSLHVHTRSLLLVGVSMGAMVCHDPAQVRASCRTGGSAQCFVRTTRPFVTTASSLISHFASRISLE